MTPGILERAAAVIDHHDAAADRGRSTATTAQRFHPVPLDPTCPHCRGGSHVEAGPVGAADWAFADAVYCISLEERDDRMLAAAREFHRVGLCRRVLFYRPNRHPTRVIEGIWEAHRAVARHALEYGAERVLITEDDVRFTRRITEQRLARVGAAIDRLPADWTIFFLGHWPLKARFHSFDTLETDSACAHAYLASPRLLRWLEANPFPGQNCDIDYRVGAGIDAAYVKLGGSYGYFPMLAVQAVRGSDHMAEKIRTRPLKKLRHLVTRTRYGEFLLSWLMRPNELLIAGIGAVAGAAERPGLRRLR